MSATQGCIFNYLATPRSLLSSAFFFFEFRFCFRLAVFLLCLCGRPVVFVFSNESLVFLLHSAA